MANILVANIPAFPNPANPDHKIKLNEAKVRQALQFSGLNPDMEEASLTAFLNEVQDPASFVDSRTWTAQTRKLAMFWYAVQTLDDSKMTADYDCPHCGKMHSHRYDLRNFAAQFTVIQGKPYREFTFNDELVRVSTLNGEAMENLELARQGLHKPKQEEELTTEQEDHNRKLLAHIRLRMLVLSVDYPNDLTEDQTERFNRKESKINAMTIRQKDAFEAEVWRLQAEMEHGLKMDADETGELYLNVGSHVCPNKKTEEGVVLSTALRVPFRNYSAIPVV